jgi:hypothetical protein
MQAQERLAEQSRHSGSARPGPPEWIGTVLPPEYGAIAAKIKALHEEAARIAQTAAVLWQTGPELVLAVGGLLRAMQWEANVADRSASYDLSVELEGGRRLLIEVVDGAEPLSRKAPEIGRILQTLQGEGGDRDRVVLVANIGPEAPPDSRPEQPVAADALRLIQGLGANVITTTTLFGIWRYSLEDLPGARRTIMRLHAQDGGIFR